MDACWKYVGNRAGEIWFAALSEIQLKKVTWRDWGGRWPNWGVGVKGAQRPSEIFKNVSRWQNLKVLDDSPQFR